MEISHPQLGKPDSVWTYEGFCSVARWNAKGGRSKEIRPFVMNGKGPEWRKPDGLAPLLYKEKIGKSSRLLIVAGEKTCDAAQRHFPARTCTTHIGGEGNAKGTDWSPVRGLDVAIWRDADDVGKKWESEVAKLCLQAGAKSVRVVEIPENAPRGWDLADECLRGWRIEEMLENAEEYEIEETNIIPFGSNGSGSHQRDMNKLIDIRAKELIKKQAVKDVNPCKLDKIRRVVEDLWPSMRLNEMTGQIDDCPDIDIARVYIDRINRETPSKENVRSVFREYAESRRYHPVRDYLNGLIWDGEPRISKWLISYGGAKCEDYVEVVGRKWLVSAVARAFNPGCQADYSLVIQGEQGTGKTSALRILGGEWYRSMTGKVVGSKDMKIEIRSAWICEFADLGTLPMSTKNSIKSFLTDNSDSYRPLYKENEINSPRNCVFAITDNPDGAGWLNDTTGARRFWPVTTGEWDVDRLRNDRDQLWAEAVCAQKGNEEWWVTTSDPIINRLVDEQGSLLTNDAWEEAIRFVVSLKDVTTTAEVWHLTFAGVGLEKCGKAEQMRIAKILKTLGFERKTARVGKDVRKEWRRG